jgi:hypothetical protein
MTLTLLINKLHIMKILSVLILALIGSLSINAQTIDEELGFIYVKADYMLETDRYEDAIKEFTNIIAKDPAYKDVLYKRGKAKYAIAAFKGTKNDLMQSFELVGITPAGIELFGKTLSNLDQRDAATTTLNTASMINGGMTKESSGASSGSTSESKDEMDEKSTVETLEDKLSSILDDLLPDRKTEEEDSTGGDTDTTGNTDTTANDTRTPAEDNADGSVDINVKDKEEEDLPDTSIKEIVIDEELTLEIKDGIGGREILSQPSIFMVSTETGEVSIDVCVDASGKVISAEYNKAKSTISTQSRVSLAVRKSKEFIFGRTGKDTCGTILFKIKAT